MLSKLQRLCKGSLESAWWSPLYCSWLLQSSSCSQFLNHGTKETELVPARSFLPTSPYIRLYIQKPIRLQPLHCVMVSFFPSQFNCIAAYQFFWHYIYTNNGRLFYFCLFSLCFLFGWGEGLWQRHKEI